MLINAKITPKRLKKVIAHAKQSKMPELLWEIVGEDKNTKILIAVGIL